MVISPQPIPVPVRSQTSNPKVYFKNLDGIRFIAAFMVLLQHMSDYKHFVGSPANIERPYVSSLGAFGVTLFFVLSGYLIFFLLFVEKKHTGTISIKDFYMRRALRIWPLYFAFGILMIVGIDYAFKLIDAPVQTPVFENLIYLFTFSVNLQLIFAAANKGIIELYWSVCIEEQFYLFAPWLVKKSGKRFIWIVIALIGIGILTKFILKSLAISSPGIFSNHINPVHFFTSSWFDAFGFGILAAYFYFNKNLYRYIKPAVEHKVIQAIVICITLCYITNLFKIPSFIELYLFSTVPSMLFAFIILAASTGKFLVNLEKPIFKTLGRISFGMYIFHALITQIILHFSLKMFQKDNYFYYEIIFPVTCFLVVAGVSWLSYELYEKHFLKMKKKYTVVQNQKYS